MSINEIFFELIRVAIGTQNTLSRPPLKGEWAELYAMSKKQSLVGICFAGMQRLYNEDKQEPNSGYGLSFMDSGLKKCDQEPITPNQEPELTQNQALELCSLRSAGAEEPRTQNLDEVQYLTWMGMAAKIQQKNEQMNARTADALEYFRERGCPCQVLKGQGVAKLYGPLAGLRQSGDIDVWMADGKEKAFELSKQELGCVEGLTNYHIHFPAFEDAEIELHFKPSFLSSPIRNKRFLEFCKLYEPNEGCSDEPSLVFNRIYILLHCYRHLCGHGVGMRQILDYYFVLVRGFTGEEKAESMMWISQLGMTKFARAMMWVLKEVFGLDDRYLLCEPDASAGRFLLNEVIHSGNMGHGEDRFDGKISQSAIARYWYNLKRDIRLLQICPHEALWDPVFNVYQYIWCKFQKTK